MNTKTVIVMVGVPGSGKTTWIQSNYGGDNTVILSSDELRKEMYGSLTEGNKHNGAVFNELHARLFAALKHTSVEKIVFDATNLSRKRRKHLYESIKRVQQDTVVETVLCHQPLQVCLERNFKRGGDSRVPSDKLKQMYIRLDVPRVGVDCDSISLVCPDWQCYEQEWGETVDVSHHNPFHMETIREHLQATANAMPKEYYSLGWFHDLGKSICRSIPKHDSAKMFFADNCGQPYNAFYGHERVSALYYLIASNTRHITSNSSMSNVMRDVEVIYQHMNAHTGITDKTIEANKLTGDELELIELLRIADSNSKVEWDMLDEYLQIRDNSKKTF